MIFCHPQAHFFHRKILPDVIGSFPSSSSFSTSSTSLGLTGSYDCDQVMSINYNSNSRNFDHDSDIPNNKNELIEQGNNASNSIRNCSNSNKAVEEICSQRYQQEYSTGQNDLMIQRVPKILDGKAYFISSFFIGLSFCNSNLKSADVTPSVLDFIYRVNIYDGKKENMKISVNVSTRLLRYVLWVLI